MAGSLRLHFGITATDAGLKLNSLKKPSTQSLAEYGLEVSRLIGIAYEEADAGLQLRLELERFKMGINHPALQGQLLARAPDNIEDAVVMGNKFVQLMKLATPALRTVETEDPVNSEARIQPVSTTDNLAKLLEACRKEMA